MKIGMIGHKRVPSREGGVEIVVEELAVRMAERGHRVELYNRKERFGRAWKQPSEYKGVRIIRIPTFRHSALNAFVYSALATVRAVFGRYDVLHYHAEGPCAMLCIPHWLGVRTVATIHGLDWQRAKWGGFSTWYLKHGERTAAKYADEVIVLSKSNQEYFRNTYQRETHYIPNGIVQREARPGPELIRSKYGLEREGYLLFLARLVPEKGLHYLIEAFRELKTDRKLVIAGGLPEEDAYVKRVRQMAEGDSRILFTDFVSGRELEELFSNCYLYILPSDIEGMAMSLLEALSFGAPCLVSDIPENLEVVGDAMPSFRHGDVRSLQARLEELLSGGTAQLRDQARLQSILSRYDWERIVTETLALYPKGEKT